MGSDFLSNETSGRIYDHEKLGGIGTVLARDLETRMGIPIALLATGALSPQ